MLAEASQTFSILTVIFLLIPYLLATTTSYELVKLDYCVKIFFSSAEPFSKKDLDFLKSSSKL